MLYLSPPSSSLDHNAIYILVGYKLTERFSNMLRIPFVLGQIYYPRKLHLLVRLRDNPNSAHLHDIQFKNERRKVTSIVPVTEHRGPLWPRGIFGVVGATP